MATINPTIRRSGGSLARVFQFAAMTKTTDDVTSPFGAGDYDAMSVQFSGTFGAGGTIVLEGSNDAGTTWATLNDPQGNPISRTAAGIKTVADVTELVRARVTAGDGTTSLAVSVMLRRNRDND